MAFLPYAVLLLLVGNPIVYLPAGVVGLAGTLTPMVAFDRLFYGKWTVSLGLPSIMHYLHAKSIWDNGVKCTNM